MAERAHDAGPGLPSAVAGATTETVGFFALPPQPLAAWLAAGIPRSRVRPARGWTSVHDAARALAATSGPVLRAVAGLDGGAWSLLLTSGPLGTDVGLLPSHAARELGVRALRATCAGGTSPARVLELFGPDGEPVLGRRRSVACADDGGRWVFETAGEPLPFEDEAAYGARRVADRFTPALLGDYLRALGVPCDAEPDWAGALVVRSR